MRPGAIELTVMPLTPTSRASVFAQPTTPGRTAGERAEPLGLALERVLAAREHDDVRALLDERFRDAETDPRRGAADDRGAPLQAKVHADPYFFLRTPTTSRTAAAESFSQRFSSA